MVKLVVHKAFLRWKHYSFVRYSPLTMIRAQRNPLPTHLSVTRIGIILALILVKPIITFALEDCLD